MDSLLGPALVSSGHGLKGGTAFRFVQPLSSATQLVAYLARLAANDTDP